MADLEGDLSENDRVELKAFAELNPQTKLEYNIFRSTFLKPDKELQFNNKEQLKKTGLLIMYGKPLYYALAIAASVIILLGVYFNFIHQPEELKIAGKTKQVSKPVEENIVVVTKDLKRQMNQPEVKTTDQMTERSETLKTNPDHYYRDLAAFRMDALASSNLVTARHISFELPEFRDSEEYTALYKQETSSLGVEKQKSFVSRFIAGLAGKVIKVDKPERKSFLEYTIEGYNLMADKDVTLEKKVDETGRVIAYSLDGEILSFSGNKSHLKE